jgi:hypothetical protein
MNRRKRFITALALSALAIGFFATGAGWRTVRIQRVSAQEPLPGSERHGTPMLIGMHTLAPKPQASPTPLETLKDRCSTSVRIEPSLIFDPNQTSMVPGKQAPIRLKRPANKNALTAFTDKRTVGLTSSGRFAWYCGSTANNHGGTLEHSNCPKGTNAMRARLGKDRLLEIQCFPD